jgi:serine/threonine protein kinase
MEEERFKNFTDRSYAPPEYMDNDGNDYMHLSVRSSYDIWQLGAVLYKLTTGRELRQTINSKGVLRVYTYFISDYRGINTAIKEMIRTRPDERPRDDFLRANLNDWKRARDQEWEKEAGRDGRYWFERAFRGLMENSGPPAPAQRTDGVKNVVPKENSDVLKRVANSLDDRKILCGIEMQSR